MRLSVRCLLAFGVVTLVATAGVLASGALAAPQSDAPDANGSEAGVPTGAVNNTDADVSIDGATNDSLGKTIASVGDVNGDGHDDLVVGAPFDGSTAHRAGAAYLFYGPIENESLHVSDADVALFGESRGAEIGWSVAGGDLNGDGHDDLVVGAPFEDGTGSNNGAVYVVYGGEDLPATANLSAVGQRLAGPNQGDRAGYALSVVDGAVGGPGADLVVGAPFADRAGEDAGALYVFDGDSIGNASDLGAADVVFTGESPGDEAGAAVDVAGDVNGDGAEDFVIGARAHGDANAGAAYVVTDLEAAANTTTANVSLANATTRLTGAAPWDRAGWSVAGVGDVNDDGLDDVAVGAPTNDAGGSASGAVHLVFGAEDLAPTVNLSDANATFHGPASGDRAGWSVAGVGDVTCDGNDDLVIGAPRWATDGTEPGTAYVVAGDGSFEGTWTLSNATMRFSGPESGDLAGWAVASAGDPDRGVVVGAPEANDDGAGAVFLFRSGCPGSTATPTSTSTPTPTDTPTPTPADSSTATPTSTTSPASATPAPTDEPIAGETADATVTSRVDPTTATDRPTGAENPVGPLAITAGLAVAGTLTALLVRRRL